MQIASLAGKRIFSEEGEELGYVLYALLTKNRAKISCLVCADNDEEEFILPFRSLSPSGEIIVTKEKRMEEAPPSCPFPVYTPVYTDAGEFLGTTCDMSFEEDGTYLVLYENGIRYPVAGAAFGQAIILKMKKSARKRTEKKRTTTAPEPQKKASAPAPQKKIVSEPLITGEPVPRMATKSGIDRINLLGRRPKETVYAQDGSVLIEAGERITPATVGRARQENLLLRLTVNTLTNL